MTDTDTTSHPDKPREVKSLLARIKHRLLRRGESEDSLREALEDYIEELSSEESHGEASSATGQEKILLGNILELRNMTVTDVMIPRVDIEAIDIQSSPQDLIAILAEKQHSRVPVYRDTLDDILGIIHMKDVVSLIGRNQPIHLKELVREVPIVSPALPVLDLLLLMRETHQHMVFVVDEYGGIDGLATMGDVLSSIVGEIQDEYESVDAPSMKDNPDGSVTADARIAIKDFEDKFGSILNDEEREEVDTLGGYLSFLTDRVPARGEIIQHKNSGLVFEILEADPRRVIKLRIRDTRPAPDTQSNEAA